jgi:hypothetical protein
MPWLQKHGGRLVFPACSRFWHETGSSERSVAQVRTGEDGDAGKQVRSRHATTVQAMAGRAGESDQWWHLLQRASSERRRWTAGQRGKTQPEIVWQLSSGLLAVACGSLGATRSTTSCV